MDTSRMASDKTVDRINGVGEIIGWKTCNARACETCLNAHGEPPWADSPRKSYCVAYPREEDMRKPPSVYYDGADCEFYRGY